LPASVRRAVVEHARRDAPRECCGFLVGRGGQIRFSLPMTNVARGVARYRIDPREHIDVRRRLRQSTPPLEIVGVYHSHPAGAPVPSRRDLADANYREWLHVIVGLGARRARLGLFSIADGKATRIVAKRLV
jgi:proteasome lid subunit RPN8/RPN11